MDEEIIWSNVWPFCYHKSDRTFPTDEKRIKIHKLIATEQSPLYLSF